MQIINPFTDIPAPIIEPNKPSGRNENMMSLSVGGGRRSLKVDGQGMYLGASNWKDAPFRVDMDGNTRMNNADIRGTISGRSTETIAKVINVNGEIVTGKLNTETGQILKDFTFAGYEGAFKSGNVSWNTNGEVTAGSGVLMNQNGIVGAKNGSATFAINSNGDATFAGTLSAPNGTLGSITAGNINGVTIKGSQIIGTTVKTAERGPRVELRRTNLLSYGS